MDSGERREVFTRLREVESKQILLEGKFSNGIQSRMSGVEKKQEHLELAQEDIEKTVTGVRLSLAKGIGMAAAISFIIQGAGATVIGIIVTKALGEN